MAVYNAVCQPGDTILGMNLSHGGHLTHGSPVNFSGRFYNVVPYGVSPDTETIDYNEVGVRHLTQAQVDCRGASAIPNMTSLPACHCDKDGAR